MADVICVRPDLAAATWPLAHRWIADAMRRVDLGALAEVEADVLSGRALLWLIWREPELLGAAVTQIGLTEKSKVCTIVACGGTGASGWIGLIGKIEEYAAGEGCNCIRVYGRKGWARLLKGYVARHVILEKRL